MIKRGISRTNTEYAKIVEDYEKACERRHQPV